MQDVTGPVDPPESPAEAASRATTEVVPDLEARIFHADPSEYGGEYEAHCLDMYKSFLGFTEHLSARREAVNRFFLTLNTAILAAVGYFGVASEEKTAAVSALYAMAALFGAYLSIQWTRFIASHQERFGVDFRILGLIERRLPLAVFSSEWELLQKSGYAKRSFMRIEIGVARAFVVAYLVMAAVMLGHALVQRV